MLSDGREQNPMRRSAVSVGSDDFLKSMVFAAADRGRHTPKRSSVVARVHFMVIASSVFLLMWIHLQLGGRMSTTRW